MDAPRSPPWRDSLALAGGCLALYVLLAQEAFHGLDVHVHIFFLTQGQLEHPLHLLYMKIVGTAWPLLRGLGMSPHHALRLLSALGTAVGVCFSHRAAALVGASRGRALMVAGLAAVVPATVFFATVAEIHGVFAAFAGAAWWAWAAVIQRASVRHGLVMGVATGIAASVHATGHLLLPLFAGLVLAWWLAPGAGSVREGAPAPGGQSPWSALVAAAAAHFAIAVVLAVALQPHRLRAPFEGQLAYLLHTALDRHTSFWVSAGKVAVHEWLLALFPLSVLTFAGIWRRGLRPMVVAVAGGLVLYLAASWALLDDLDERGAYLLPLAFPMALLTSWALPPAATLLAGAAALGVAFAQVEAHDHVDQAGWVAGFEAVVEDQPVALICRDVAEQEAITRVQPDIPFVRVDSLLAGAEDPSGYARFCEVFDAMVAQFQKGGRGVLITRPAYELMLETGKPLLVRFLREHLPAHHRVEQVSRGGFAALRIKAP